MLWIIFNSKLGNIISNCKSKAHRKYLWGRAKATEKPGAF